MKNGILSLVLLTAFFSASAGASILIEPHLGYIFPSKTTYSSAEYKYNGPQYGMRAGLSYLGLEGGLGYTHSTYKLEISASSVTVKPKYARDEFGVFVGYKFPILLRAWVGYNFSNKWKNKDSSTDYFMKGSSTEIGLGFTGLPIINVNLSYKMHNIDKQSSSGVESAVNPEFKPKEIALSISAPFRFL